MGTVTYTPPLGTVLGAGLAQTLTVNVASTADYNAAALSVPIDVKRPVSLGRSLAQPTITYGDASATLSGQVVGVVSVPTGEVDVTLGGITQPAAIDPATGDFSTVFSTATLSAAGSPYFVTYAYPGDSIFAPAASTTRLTVNRAAPAISWAAPPRSLTGPRRRSRSARRGRHGAWPRPDRRRRELFTGPGCDPRTRAPRR